MAINRESRCICWAAIVAFFLLSLGLFYYFFAQAQPAPTFDVNSLPTLPIPTKPVPGLPFAKEDTERHSRDLVDLINGHPNRTWVADLNPSAVG